MNIKTKELLLIIPLLSVTACSLSPGMHFDSKSPWLNDKEYVYIENIDKNIIVENINTPTFKEISLSDGKYRIGVGDQISFTVWGLPEVFTVSNISPDQNLRRIDSNGDIFIPYVGTVNAIGKTQSELRDDITKSLGRYFNNPQLDITIAKFNSQKVYILGEVLKPQRINLTDIPLSLSDALGEVYGLNNNTANGSEVFVVRQGTKDSLPRIFKADLSSPSGFVGAGNFYLISQDIIYVNAKGTARWNRVISQFFPFSSFLNSVNNLTD